MAKQPEPVTLHAEDPRIPVTLRGTLQKALEELKNAMTFGAGVEDYPAYRERVGQARGLQQAIEICQNLEKDLSGQ